MVIGWGDSKVKEKYGYLIDYRPYTAGIMAAGFPDFPRFGLAAPYSAYNCRYSADYLAAAEGFSPLLAALQSLKHASGKSASGSVFSFYTFRTAQ
jgi:hypothetical protein